MHNTTVYVEVNRDRPVWFVPQATLTTVLSENADIARGRG